MTSQRRSLARAKLDAIDEKLKEGQFDSAEWDLHKDLVHAAQDSTNGNSGNIEALSTTVSLLAAAFTQSSLREPERLRSAFAGMHDDICPVIRESIVAEDGKIVRPWERKRAGVFGSLNVKLGGKEFNAAGPVAAILAVGLIMLCFKWLGMSVSSDVRSAVNSAVKAQIVEKLSQTDKEQ